MAHGPSVGKSALVVAVGLVAAPCSGQAGFAVAVAQVAHGPSAGQGAHVVAVGLLAAPCSGQAGFAVAVVLAVVLAVALAVAHHSAQVAHVPSVGQSDLVTGAVALAAS